MTGKDGNRTLAQHPDAICVWCKQRFENEDERELHVSKLGAPGQFHPACFEEYETTTSS